MGRERWSQTKELGLGKSERNSLGNGMNRIGIRSQIRPSSVIGDISKQLQTKRGYRMAEIKGPFPMSLKLSN